MERADFKTLDSLDELNRCIGENRALLVWFTGPDCRVCKDLKPKVAELMVNSFPQITLREVDCARSRDAAAQHQVFSIPALLVFFDGSEFLRKGRNFSLVELGHLLERPYHLLFD